MITITHNHLSKQTGFHLKFTFILAFERCLEYKKDWAIASADSSWCFCPRWREEFIKRYQDFTFHLPDANSPAAVCARADAIMITFRFTTLLVLVVLNAPLYLCFASTWRRADEDFVQMYSGLPAMVIYYIPILLKSLTVPKHFFPSFGKIQT